MPVIKPVRAVQLNRSHLLARGLVGYWLFNEATGSKVFDLSKNANTGTLQGDVLWQIADVGSCLQFDGAGDYVDCGNSQTLDANTDLTICARIKTTASSNTPVIVAKGSGSTTNYELDIATSGKVRFFGYDSGGIYKGITGGQTVVVTDGLWHQVAGTFDGTDWTLYVDGRVDTSETEPHTLAATSQSLRIGARQNSQYFNGSISHVAIWRRALSAVEIALLYREPFCMFVVTIEPGLLYPAGQIVWLAVATTATTSISGILTLSRRREMERQWLIEALFNGTTANAFKLGTVLTGGWFWMRRAGCSALYRGPSMEQVDFANILTVAEQDADSISPPSFMPHLGGSTYFYVVRRFNNCGYPERTLAAAVKVAINIEGNLTEPQPNNIFAWRVDQVDGNKTELIWFYSPLEQMSRPARFNVCYDGGTGQIDYENPIATINYKGRKFYTYKSDALAAGRYLFGIKVEDIAGIENNSLRQLPIQFVTTRADAIEILSVKNI